jgi:hypothetical protein
VTKNIWLARRVSWTLGLLVVFVGVGTTTARAATFTYDAPIVGRVEVHPFDDAPAIPVRLTGERDESASLPVGTEGTSTTPSALRNATNTALQFADDGVLGFGSMSSFRRAYGSAGPNAQWHHVVEQTTGNVTQFGATSIHNTSNIVRLDTAIHRQVSGYYSSVQPFTGGQTVRQWLSSQPFDAQTQFGLDVLKQFGAAG